MDNAPRPSGDHSGQLQYLEHPTVTDGTRSIAYDLFFPTHTLPSKPLTKGIQIPPRLRARLQPTHSNDQPKAILHKIEEKQQRAAIQREVILQEKKRSARIPLAKLSTWANINVTKKALSERQKTASLRREEKIEEKVKKATALKKSPWFSADQITPTVSVDNIRERLSQADERRQVNISNH
jgi:hypothetical protein